MIVDKSRQDKREGCHGIKWYCNGKISTRGKYRDLKFVDGNKILMRNSPERAVLSTPNVVQVGHSGVRQLLELLDTFATLIVSSSIHVVCL